MFPDVLTTLTQIILRVIIPDYQDVDKKTLLNLTTVNVYASLGLLRVIFLKLSCVSD